MSNKSISISPRVRWSNTQHPSKGILGTINQAQIKIEPLPGIKRSKTQVAEFLEKPHLRCRQVCMIPVKADSEK